jgi:hypothetical protein
MNTDAVLSLSSNIMSNLVAERLATKSEWDSQEAKQNVSSRTRFFHSNG